jgi:hypothetical protein
MAQRVVCSIVIGVAAVTSALAQNEITWFVLGAGGQTESAHHSILATIGEPVVGEATSATHAMRAGFWPCVGGLELGDLNCDGVVDFDDINAFVLALSDPGGYAAQYPNCDILNGDCNADGVIDFDDINSFVAILSG